MLAITTATTTATAAVICTIELLAAHTIVAI
jgi:hypothetical protein